MTTSTPIEPTNVQRPAQPYVGITRSVTMATFAEVADRFPDIFGWPGARGVAPAGSPFFRYHVIDMARELVGVTKALLDWAAGRGLVWDRTDAPEGQRWGGRLEFYHTDPAEEPDMNNWTVELAFRLADSAQSG
jgi:hypothetical protein